MSLPETMAMTGHHSVATVMGYFRAESSLNSKASRMLDEECAQQTQLCERQRFLQQVRQPIA
jgi:hypothetical protein